MWDLSTPSHIYQTLWPPPLSHVGGGLEHRSPKTSTWYQRGQGREASVQRWYSSSPPPTSFSNDWNVCQMAYNLCSAQETGEGTWEILVNMLQFRSSWAISLTSSSLKMFKMALDHFFHSLQMSLFWKTRIRNTVGKHSARTSVCILNTVLH